jgi:hypothetical protein
MESTFQQAVCYGFQIARPSITVSGSYLTDKAGHYEYAWDHSMPFLFSDFALILVGRGQPSAPLRKFPILPRYACRIERR